MAECRFRPPKTSQEEEKLGVQCYSEVTCAFGLINFLTSVPFLVGNLQQVESEPKHEVATIERELKFRKRMGFQAVLVV